MSKGVIYILTNPSFPKYVKIGYATDLEKRMKTLNSNTAVPFAFRAYAIYEVDAKLTDKSLHKLIDDLNPALRAIEEFNGKKHVREFYEMSPKKAYSLLECIATISGTKKCLKKMKPEGHEIKYDEEAKEIAKETKRGPFRFSKYDIPVGSKLTFTEDPNIEVTVVDDKHISHNGIVTSTSRLAQELLNSEYPMQGPLYFEYEGEKLTERRERMDG